MTPGVAYTIATGRLFCHFADLQHHAERLLHRPVFTHELADPVLWDDLRLALEEELADDLTPDKETGTCSPPAK